VFVINSEPIEMARVINENISDSILFFSIALKEEEL